MRHIGDPRAIYLPLATIQDGQDQSFEELTSEVATLLELPDVDRIIVDLRRNSGGDNTLAERLRRMVARSDLNYLGGIVVLIAPQTFSAAINVAARFERDSFAIFVGSPSGAGPNHYGDSSRFRGSASKLPYIVSTLSWQDSVPFDNRIWIKPDIPAAQVFSDWLAGRDPALDLALSADLGRGLDEDQWYSPWRRPSQSAEWQPFWRR